MVTERSTPNRTPRGPGVAVAILSALWLLAPAGVEAQPSLQSHALKIFRVDPILYPYVQVYFRTFDQNMQPLLNLNELNIGLMVGGRSYDPKKMQYRLETFRDRKQAIRTVVVLDASKSMVGAPFEAAVKAIGRFIDSKRPQDQIAILAIRDTSDGHDLISTYERDPGALVRRLADVKADGNQTRLYDAIGAAMQMAAMPSQGGPDQEDYIVSSAVLVLSDGKDEGSALSRDDLNTRISTLTVPIPIYSVAYTKIDRSHFRNLEALSKNSFGVYYEAATAVERMQQMVEQIQNILQSDYVLTFRSYVPVDGRDHGVKLGVEYPSRSGRMTYESATFEAIEAPPVPAILARVQALSESIEPLADGDPYLKAPGAASPSAAGAP